jgi:hypothetical protein
VASSNPELPIKFTLDTPEMWPMKMDEWGMVTYLNTRWGGSSRDPSMDALCAALAELQTRDPEHPDCWLCDEHGWTVAVHETGKIVFENVETGEGPWHLESSEPAVAITLWQLLQQGQIERIKQRAWIDGYGG